MTGYSQIDCPPGPAGVQTTSTRVWVGVVSGVHVEVHHTQTQPAIQKATTAATSRPAALSFIPGRYPTGRTVTHEGGQGGR